MKRALGAALCFCSFFSLGLAHKTAPARRAQPADPQQQQPPPPRAVPAESGDPNPAPPPATPEDTVAPAQRQLDYANGLFSRKLYDLAAPEFEKYLDQYPKGA